jgi:hypothetical protein
VAARLLDFTPLVILSTTFLSSRNGIPKIFALSGTNSGGGDSKPAAAHFSSQSAHFGAGSGPHGMIGTLEVEFFGEPSISLSE